MTLQILEFFFGNFWHWLGLMIMLSIIFKTSIITISPTRLEKKKIDLI